MTIPEDLQKALWEAIKEPIRLIVLTAATIIIDWLIANIFMFKMNLGMEAVILIALRFVDKLLHEWGKTTQDATLTKGLTRF